MGEEYLIFASQISILGGGVLLLLIYMGVASLSIIHFVYLRAGKVADSVGRAYTSHWTKLTEHKISSTSKTNAIGA